jgi:hypothetical protein
MFNKLVNTLGIMSKSSIHFANYLVLLSLQYYIILTRTVDDEEEQVHEQEQEQQNITR